MKKILAVAAALLLSACMTEPTPAGAGKEKAVRIHGDTTVNISDTRLLVIDFLQSDTAMLTIRGGRHLQEIWIHNNSTWEIRVADTDGGMRMYPFQTAHMIYDAPGQEWYWTLEGK